MAYLDLFNILCLHFSTKHQHTTCNYHLVITIGDYDLILISLQDFALALLYLGIALFGHCFDIELCVFKDWIGNT